MSDDALLEMPFLRNIGFVLTYQCQVACPHCIIQAGPHRTEAMTLEDALDWVEKAARYRDGYIKILSLTGGEPFFDIPKLKQISDSAHQQGFIVSAVTNAFWATTPDEAVSILRDLPAINMLAISADEYHQVSIPFERVENAIFAAKTCGIPYNVHVCTENELDEKYRQIIDSLLKVTGVDTINTAVTFPVGRALKRLGVSGYETTPEPPCSACVAASSPIVFPDGRVIACIGAVIDLNSDHPLVLGNLRENTLEEILDRAEINPILHTLRVWGPRKLIAMIQQAGLGEELPATYIKDSVCYACYHLMSSPKIVEFLTGLAQEAEFREKIAYARVYYLQETRMAEVCIGHQEA